MDKLPAPLKLQSSPSSIQWRAGHELKSGYGAESRVQRSGRPDPELRCLSLPRVRLVVPESDCLVLGGGLRRKRPQRNAATIIPGIIFTMRPPIQPPPPIVITDVDPARNCDNETMTNHDQITSPAIRLCSAHLRQGNASTLNFTSLIAPSICALMHTKRVKTDATIFKPRCSRTGMCYRLDRVQALPLVSTRILRLANSSPKTARSPARRFAAMGREPSGKTSGEMSRVMSAQLPGNGRTVAAAMPPNVRQDNSQTARLAPDLAAQYPRLKLARQLATWPRNSRETSRKMTRQNPAVMFSTIPF